MARPEPAPLVDAASLSEAVTGSWALELSVRRAAALPTLAEAPVHGDDGTGAEAGTQFVAAFIEGGPPPLPAAAGAAAAAALPLDNAYERLVSAVGLLAADAPCWPAGDLPSLPPPKPAAAPPLPGACAASPAPPLSGGWGNGRSPTTGEALQLVVLGPTTGV
ncbi:hypothetical protein TSOC_008260, partial [Tetrabaena socialis]